MRRYGRPWHGVIFEGTLVHSAQRTFLFARNIQLGLRLEQASANWWAVLRSLFCKFHLVDIHILTYFTYIISLQNFKRLVWRKNGLAMFINDKQQPVRCFLWCSIYSILNVRFCVQFSLLDINTSAEYIYQKRNIFLYDVRYYVQHCNEIYLMASQTAQSAQTHRLYKYTSPPLSCKQPRVQC